MCCRLQEHFDEDLDTGAKLNSLNYIYSQYKDAGGQVYKNTFAKIIRRIFKNARFLNTRVDHKRVTLLGVKERVVNSDIKSEYPCSFNSISEWIPSTFFISKKDSEEIHADLYGDIINGYQTVNKIMFKSSGVWHFVVGGKDINLPEIHIDPHFRCSRISVQNICSIVAKIRLCRGKEKKFSTKSKNHLVEFLGETKTEIYRSNSCKKVIPFSSISFTCRACQYTGRSPQPTFKEIIADKSKGRKKSHQWLQACVSENEEYFCDGDNQYWKKDVQKLCLAYNVTVSKTDSIKQNNDALIDAILKCESIPNPDILNEDSVVVGDPVLENSLADNRQVIGTDSVPITCPLSAKEISSTGPPVADNRQVIGTDSVPITCPLSAKEISSTEPPVADNRQVIGTDSVPITCPLSAKEISSKGQPTPTSDKSQQCDIDIEIISPVSLNPSTDSVPITCPLSAKEISSTGPPTSDKSQQFDKEIEIISPVSLNERPSPRPPLITAEQSRNICKIARLLSAKVKPSVPRTPLRIVVCNKSKKNVVFTCPLLSKKIPSTGPLSVISKSHKNDKNILITSNLSSKEAPSTRPLSFTSDRTRTPDKHIEITSSLSFKNSPITQSTSDISDKSFSPDKHDISDKSFSPDKHIEITSSLSSKNCPITGSPSDISDKSFSPDKHIEITSPLSSKEIPGTGQLSFPSDKTCTPHNNFDKDIKITSPLSSKGIPITGPLSVISDKCRKNFDKDIKITSLLSSKETLSTEPLSFTSDKTCTPYKHIEITSSLSSKEIPGTGQLSFTPNKTFTPDKNFVKDIEITSPLSSKEIPNIGPSSIISDKCCTHDKNFAEKIEITSPSSSMKVLSTGALSATSDKTHKLDSFIEKDQRKAKRKRRKPPYCKRKSKKRKETGKDKQDEVDEHSDCCPVCLGKYEGLTDWIECGKCNMWLHGECAGITSEEHWRKYETDDFTCPFCQYPLEMDFFSKALSC